MERIVALTGNRTSIVVEDLPSPIQQRANFSASPYIEVPEEGINFQEVVTEIERDLIVQSLRRTNGNKKMAAKLLNLKRTTLIEKIKRIGLAERSLPLMDSPVLASGIGKPDSMACPQVFADRN
jgi:transcriptional regulator with PAS, ATPase and Fis domain